MVQNAVAGSRLSVVPHLRPSPLHATSNIEHQTESGAGIQWIRSGERRRVFTGPSRGYALHGTWPH